MRLKRIKIAREEDQRRLTQLQQSRGEDIDIDNAEAQIKELCKKIKRNLKKCTFAEKRQAINDLDVSVIATDDKLDIKIAVPTEFTAIEKKSRYTLSGSKKKRR